MNPISPHQFVRWFRDSSPYIDAHRGKTFVVSFGGETVADGLFSNLAHDFALLSRLGVRLVLVHGIRPQVEQRLQARGASLRYHQGLRLTDDLALTCVQEAAGSVRVEIEALLSMGVANSPMAGTAIRVTSGNFVVAKPLGVRNGIDYGHTGEVRRIDTESIRRHLDAGSVVLLSPLGYSPTGEIFNLSAEEVATATAVALKAHKLLLLMEQPLRKRTPDVPIQQITTRDAEALMASPGALPESLVPHLQAACTACRCGIERAHLLDRHIDGAMLLELFTRDGIGTLVSEAPYEEMRAATIQDVGGILDLIGPLEKSGTLISRSRERLEMEIDDYFVIDRDGLVVACAALHVFPSERIGELACLAVHPDYRDERRGERLLQAIEERACNLNLQRIFALTTRTSHWFLERGFTSASLASLPTERQLSYNRQRNSKTLIKQLDPVSATAPP